MAHTPPTILILGAGYGGLQAARSLDEAFRRRLQPPALVLVDQRPFHQLITQLHEVAAGTLEAGQAMVPLEGILEGRRIEFALGRVRRIDVQERQVVLDTRQVSYDYLVMALGSETELFGIPGLAEHAFRLRWLDEARHLRAHLARLVRQVSVERDPERRKVLPQVVVGGGGYTGVELIAELADSLRAAMGRLAQTQGAPQEPFSLTLVEAGPEIMAGFRRQLVEEARRQLERKGVAILTNTGIQSVAPEVAHLSTGASLQAGTIVWTGGIRGNPLIESCGLATGPRGRALVNAYLQSVSDPRVYVIGDSAFATDPATGVPLAPSAQLAMKQGQHVARNLHRLLLGLEPRPFVPGHLATIVSLGTDSAIADLERLVFYGRSARILKHLAVIRYLYGLGGVRLALRHAPEVLEAVPVIGSPPGRLAA
ncbi:MAG: NAD(P)/FAD-dependent oxidoreductase [Chloroflexi bacterium]|nr:NAD(P)/FAD-dependent oxidoreductase [Chloroflexota bacterium]